MSDELIIGNVEPNSTVSYEQWLDHIQETIISPTATVQDSADVIFDIIMANIDIEAVRCLGDIIEAYSLLPVCIYENKPYAMRAVKTHDLANFLEHYKQKNQKIIMYHIYPNKVFAWDRKSTQANIVDEYRTIRFAVVGDTV